jgi:hypothetical protein
MWVVLTVLFVVVAVLEWLSNEDLWVPALYTAAAVGYAAVLELDRAERARMGGGGHHKRPGGGVLRRREARVHRTRASVAVGDTGFEPVTSTVSR